jgi:tagaturonate epimerase
MELEKYSMGVGDRFGSEGAAQLRAVQKATAKGIRIAPVWNKSNREHMLARTKPEATRKAADEAVRECRWKDSYYVDADHIGLATVDAFLPCSDFFTIEMADFIGKPVGEKSVASFAAAMAQFKGSLAIQGMQTPLKITDAVLADFALRYLYAIEEAGKVYRYIAGKIGPDSFITEVSADEAQSAQTPAELFLIMAALAREGIPAQTIAPKFTGAFLKGVDYVGDPKRFTREFYDDLAVIAFAVNAFNLPRNLKLSIHTGSDKFTLYPIMHRAIKDMNTGIHLKTAGTTWLEEATGIAASNGAGLKFVKDVYQESYQRYDELCKPYLAVINIEKNRLPSPAQVASWSSKEFLDALQHDPLCPGYNPQFRQLMHVGFSIAAEMGTRFYELLKECRTAIEENVTRNLYDRHICPLFLGE